MTGGATLDLEMILAEGGGLRGAPLTPAIAKKRNRCRIAQLPLNDVKFDAIEVLSTIIFEQKRVKVGFTERCHVRAVVSEGLAVQWGAVSRLVSIDR